MGPAFLRQMQI